jgi:hypothetical protein
MVSNCEPTLKSGDRFKSPGCLYEYEVIGACCQLFDRESLPYPSCSLDWKGKQPSWRRIGRRFINEPSSANREIYYVRRINAQYEQLATTYWVFTYWQMSPELKKWWHKK